MRKLKIGYLGKGNYKASENGEDTIYYKYWSSMLRRCYDEIFQNKNMTYKDCTVCEEWLNFQVFSKWFDENYYTIENEKMQLDKDILNKGNKVYSPKTCIFVPQRINNLFTKSNATRGKYPIGINYYKRYNNFVSKCNTLEKRVTIGYFNTPEEAFNEGYKPFKEDYIKQVANDYKEQIPKYLYDAMMNYIVEIDD